MEKQDKARKCIQCGKVFTPIKQAKYCSGRCRIKYNRKPKPKILHTITCVVCGKQITSKVRTKKLCGCVECRRKWQRNRQAWIKDNPVIDPLREPFVQEMIRKYAEIKRLLKEEGMTIDHNSVTVDMEINRLRSIGVYVPE